MKTMRTVTWLLLAAMLTVSLISCSLWRDDKPSPTAPADGSAAVLTNSFSTRNSSQVFEWNPGQEVFCVSLAEAGDYLIIYTTEMGGPFYMVLRAAEPAYLYVGLQAGDAIASVQLHKGTIAEGAEPLDTDGLVTWYVMPDVADVAWSQVFTPAQVIDLPEGDGECRVIINVKRAQTAVADVQTAKTKALAAGRKFTNKSAALRPGAKNGQPRQPLTPERRQQLKEQFKAKMKELMRKMKEKLGKH